MGFKLVLAAYFVSCLFLQTYAFTGLHTKSMNPTRMRNNKLNMVVDTLMTIDPFSTWLAYTQQGIAATPVCPAWGEPGWAPFCFLNGNPVFNAFDVFQAFVQGNIVNFHDILHDKLGVQNAYGPSIILFTCIIRLILFPVNYQQISTTQKSSSLNPKIAEIRERYPNNKELQGQMTALLYEETEVNPLAGCLPAIIQIPIFISLYRSFLNLASQGSINEPFLWFPNLEGPTMGEKNMDWLTVGWANNVPPLGWHDTIAYLTIPVLLFVAQSVSLNILTPPSDDPKMQQTQRLLKYLPLMISYFSLSVPSGLGLYWIISNILSTLTTFSIKAYLKKNPAQLFDIDLDAIAAKFTSRYMIPAWGYSSEQQMLDEADLNYRPIRTSKIPADFI